MEHTIYYNTVAHHHQNTSYLHLKTLYQVMQNTAEEIFFQFIFILVSIAYSIDTGIIHANLSP